MRSRVASEGSGHFLTFSRMRARSSSDSSQSNMLTRSSVDYAESSHKARSRERGERVRERAACLV